MSQIFVVLTLRFLTFRFQGMTPFRMDRLSHFTEEKSCFSLRSTQRLDMFDASLSLYPPLIVFCRYTTAR